MGSKYETFAGKGFEMESNTRTTEQMAESFKTPAEKVPEKTAEAIPQADGAGDEAEAPESPEIAPVGGEKLGKPRHDMKARMLEATRKESEAKKRVDEIERRANQLEAELRALKGGKVEPDPKPAPPATAPVDGRPKLEDFESIEDHAEAVTNWALDRREKTATEARKQAEAEKATEEKFTSFAQRMGAHIEKDPDFWSRQDKTVVELRPFSVLSQEERSKAGPLNALADHFLVSANAPALIEYFSGKPDELQRLSTLHPGDFWRELGRIEARLDAAPTATAPAPVSKAAPPARPVTGGPPIGNQGPSADDSDDDYIRKRRAQEVRKLSSR